MYAGNTMRQPRINDAAFCLKNVDANTLPLDIVLVEDDVSDALLTKVSLDHTNIPYSLTRLEKGSHLLSQLARQSKKPDLIMLDLGLPDIDGFGVLAGLSQMPPPIRAIPIAIMTGYRHFDYIQNIYPVHIIDYLNKPIRAPDVYRTLAHVLMGRNV